MTGDSARLVAARERVAAATVALEEVAGEADVARRRRSARLDRLGAAATGTGAEVVAATVTVVLIVVAAVMTVIAQRADDDHRRLDEVLAAAGHAVSVTLTADPAAPAAYLDAVRGVAGGEFLRRVESASQEIGAAVAAQGLPSTGQVVSAGVVGEVSASGPVQVLVVAQATNPQLLGGSAGDNRLVLDVAMVHADDRWTMDEAQSR